MTIDLNTKTVTRITRKAHGDKSWTAETRRNLIIHGHQARIILHTSKDLSGGTVSTTASICWPQDRSEITRLGFGDDGDFYKTFAKEKTRCTEASVTKQHHLVRDSLDHIIELALEHYPNPASVLNSALKAE